MICNQGHSPRTWSGDICMFFETAMKPACCEGKREVREDVGFGR